MTDNEVLAIYGSPGNTNNFTQILAPFPLVIAWDKNVLVQKLTCHKKIAQPLLNVLKDLLSTYGKKRLRELHIDYYGGLYNLRKMRGSATRWSRHSWAIAIDLDPERNLLREDHTTARFARSEYKPMIDIFYRHGFVGYGPEQDYDWMHFEIGI
ncbi:M15 family metallopeptidase [Niabella ginsengisoli]|uniref:M15 family metallopeptidase n=1 Tax=Niabella ginsengisoli TaxID=522298 RepID=A0ABS9SG42_9BACT|nr:M15 family metallopeptidase [Niabella ginsengisoli]MCH5597328.1 M15 family metallopeptidase [Niabella ginsengisoli]